MSELQIGLLGIGAAIVVTVLLYNWLQERRFRRQADAAFRTPLADVLMEPGIPPHASRQRVEPALHEPVVDAGMAGEAGGVVEPRLRVDSAGQTGEGAFAEDWPAPPSDELIEYRVRVGGDGIEASAFADAYHHARTLGKAVRWAGLAAGAAEWEELQPWRDVRYQQVIATLQLADRNGAVQEEQLTALCAMLQATAQAHGLRVACDDVDDALQRAQAIDRFCVDVDVLIGLNVVARGDGVVDLARVVREAETSGMVLGADGAFQLLDSRGEPLFALCNHDAEPFRSEAADGQATHGVTLQFDVPRVPDGIRVFDGMVAFGRGLATEVDGILVDDNLRPLTDAGIEKIRDQLTHIYQRMEARGVPSGSRRSLRLFS